MIASTMIRKRFASLVQIRGRGISPLSRYMRIGFGSVSLVFPLLLGAFSETLIPYILDFALALPALLALSMYALVTGLLGEELWPWYGATNKANICKKVATD